MQLENKTQTPLSLCFGDDKITNVEFNKYKINMRTIVTILLMMFLAQTTKAQEFIFETTAGEIVTKSKFIDQFQNDVYTNITPYILKQTK